MNYPLIVAGIYTFAIISVIHYYAGKVKYLSRLTDELDDDLIRCLDTIEDLKGVVINLQGGNSMQYESSAWSGTPRDWHWKQTDLD